VIGGASHGGKCDSPTATRSKRSCELVSPRLNKWTRLLLRVNAIQAS